MIRPTLTLAVTTAALAVPGASAGAKPSLCERADELRAKVAKKHGKRAAGRDICRLGARHHGRVVATTVRMRVQYVQQLRRLVRLPIMAAVAPRQPPAGTLSRSSGYAIPSGIVQCESGGDYSAVNTSNPNRPAGVYQIITSTWLAFGGGRYAPTADGATPAQQDAIATKIYAGGAGRGHWAC